MKRMINVKTLQAVAGEMEKRGLEKAPLTYWVDEKNGEMLMELGDNDGLTVRITRAGEKISSIVAGGSGTFPCKKFFLHFGFKWNPEKKSWIRNSGKWEFIDVPQWKALLQKFCERNCINVKFC